MSINKTATIAVNPEQSGLMIVELDLDYFIISCNQLAAQTFVGNLPQPVTLPLHDLVNSGADKLICALKTLQKNKAVAIETLDISTTENRLMQVKGCACLSETDNARIMLLLHDVTGAQLELERLRLISKVFDYSGEAIMITDSTDTILTVNDSFCRLTGYTPEETLGKQPAFFSSGLQNADFYRQMWAKVHSDGHWKGEVWSRRKNGEICPEWVAISAVHNDERNVDNYITIISDITEQKIIEGNLRHQAQHDFLTGLPNRILLQDRFTQATVASNRREPKQLSLFFIDLDGFKKINDTYGHAIGDQLLQAVASRLKKCVRESDTVSRHGGDEFIILLLGGAETINQSEIAETILSALRTPFVIDNHSLAIGASIGCSNYPENGTMLDDLIKTADAAMYHAKKHR